MGSYPTTEIRLVYSTAYWARDVLGSSTKSIKNSEMKWSKNNIPKILKDQRNMLGASYFWVWAELDSD